MDFELLRDRLADEDAALERVRTVGYLLDDAFPVPKTNHRFGLDPVLGILPVAGDGVAALISLYILVEALNVGASAGTLGRMLLNVLLDLVVGSIPVLGSLFDAAWKANQRNVVLFEKHLDEETQADPQWAT